MNKFMLAIFLTISSLAHAATYTVPNASMNAAQLSNLISIVSQFVPVGSYSGTTNSNSGKCGFVVSLDSGELDLGFYGLLAAKPLGFIAQDGGQVLFSQLDLSIVKSADPTEMSLNLVLGVSPEETPNYIRAVTITEKNGVPVSLQSGFAPAKNNTVSPGQVYDTNRDFLPFSSCDQLVKANQ